MNIGLLATLKREPNRYILKVPGILFSNDSVNEVIFVAASGSK